MCFQLQPILLHDTWQYKDVGCTTIHKSNNTTRQYQPAKRDIGWSRRLKASSSRWWFKLAKPVLYMYMYLQQPRLTVISWHTRQDSSRLVWGWAKQGKDNLQAWFIDFHAILCSMDWKYVILSQCIVQVQIGFSCNLAVAIQQKTSVSNPSKE